MDEAKDEAKDDAKIGAKIEAKNEDEEEERKRHPVVRRARRVALWSGFGSFLALATACLAWFLSASSSPSPANAPATLVVAVNVVTAGLLVSAAAAAYFVLRAPPTSGTWTALLTLTAAPVPGIAAAFSVLAYLWNPYPPYHSGAAITFGLIVAFVIWLFIANLGRVYTQVERANPRAYGELLVRLDDVLARVDGLPLPTAHDSPSVAAARACVVRHTTALESALRVAGWKSRAPQWLNATGYVDMWNRIHRVEEALIILEPVSSVRGALEQDRLRLDDSVIRNHDRLLNLLNRAEEDLANAEMEADGRALFRKVRHAINEYRDSRVDGLVRARNGLLRTIIVTGLIAYLLLELALLAGIPQGTVISAAALFLVASLVGLFKRLYDEGRPQTAVEDYGLALAQVLHAALASGLAGIAGVFLVATLASVAPTLNGAGSSGSASLDSGLLLRVFDLANYPAGLVAAAVFGLTPSLLLRKLQQATEQYVSELEASDTATAHPGPRARG